MRAVILAAVLAMLPAAAAQAANEVSTTDRLKDRREVAAGTRAYSIGFQDGRFYAHGWHIMGEMGGIWAPPLKLADGVWFGVDDAWVGPATRFTSGRGYTRYTLPAAGGLRLRRTDFVPDGRRAALFGLELSNPASGGQDRHGQGRRPLRADGRLPVDRHQGPADRRRQRAGHGGLRERHAGLPRRRSTRRSPRRTAPHSRARPDPASAARRRAIVCTTATRSRRRPATTARTAAARAASCATASRLRAGERETVWIAVAAGRPELDATLKTDPAAQLRAKIARRAALASRSRLDLPGDRELQESIEWGKQNLADLTQTAVELQDPLRRRGQGLPAADRHHQARDVRRRRLPGLPVAVRDRRRVHGVRERRARPVRADQGAPAGAARRQRRAQRPLGQDRARDRHRRLGLLRRERRQRQHRRVGQVPERGRARVALDRRQPLPRRPL